MDFYIKTAVIVISPPYAIAAPHFTDLGQNGMFMRISGKGMAT
jgi:hypothetical protein